MASSLETRYLENGKVFYDICGASIEDKPIYPDMASGSAFTEIDTNKIYLFEEITQTWFPVDSELTSIKGATVTLGSSIAYDGTEKTQAVSSVVLGGTTLTANTDYVVQNNKATLPGTYTLRIVGIGNYNGIIAKEFTVSKGSGSITADPDTLSLTEEGEAGESELTIVGDGDVSVASSAEAVATAELDDDGNVFVTPVAEGSATVTVTLANGELYNGTTKTISVTVSAASSDDDDDENNSDDETT